MESHNRRKFLKNLSLTGSGLLLAPGLIKAGIAAADESPLKGKKVLLVWGGWKGHEPEQCKDIFAPWLKEEGADLTVSDTLDIYTDKALMDSLDLIIPVWTMGKIEKEQE